MPVTTAMNSSAVMLPATLTTTTSGPLPVNDETDRLLRTIYLGIYKYVIPIELVVGLSCQVMNLSVLRHSSFRSMSAYTPYLRTLSCVYLILSPLILFNILRKLAVVGVAEDNYLAYMYMAHLEQYSINLLFMVANLIIVVIACEAAYSLMYPLRGRTRWPPMTFIIIVSLFIFTGLCLLPLTFINHVNRIDLPLADDGAAVVTTAVPMLNETSAYNETQPLTLAPAQLFADASQPPAYKYKITKNKSELVKLFKVVLAGFLELWLLILILFIYGAIYTRHLIIMRSTRLIRRSAQIRSAQKAIITCSAPIVAYLLSNMLSAIKELLYLLKYLTANAWITGLLSSEWGNLFVSVCNMCLVFNFTLYVILQYFARRQYRNTVNVNFGHQLVRQMQRYMSTSGSHAQRITNRYRSGGATNENMSNAVTESMSCSWRKNTALNVTLLSTLLIKYKPPTTFGEPEQRTHTLEQLDEHHDEIDQDGSVNWDSDEMRADIELAAYDHRNMDRRTVENHVNNSRENHVDNEDVLSVHRLRLHE